jgi:hypothetical protein
LTSKSLAHAKEQIELSEQTKAAINAFSGPGAYAATLSFIVLIGVLPALGNVHLMYFTRTQARPT